MCREYCGVRNGLPVWASTRRGHTKDLTFTREEFINRCYLVKDGPRSDDDEDWLRVMQMYNRMKTLRIFPIDFCGGLPKNLKGTALYEMFVKDFTANRGKTYEWGLPFTVQEFLTLCDEWAQYEVNPTTKNDRNFRRNPEFKGSKYLVCHMVQDLAGHCINFKEFLGDHVPPEMEKNYILLCAMAAAQGPHTEDYDIDYARFMVSMFAPGGSRHGRPIGPMTHLQAAVFVGSLEPCDAPTKLLEKWTQPHIRCRATRAIEDVKLVLLPCCNCPLPSCCLIELMVALGAFCPVCQADMLHAADPNVPPLEVPKK